MTKPLNILFATMPLDGHFNPLTGLASHLKNMGHNVRWYTQQIYEQKLQKLDIHHYPFRKARQVNQFNLDEVFAERLTHKSQIARLNFDLQNVFILRAPEFFDDICEINKEFPFDILIADVMFTASPIVKEKLKKPVITIGVLPLIESSVDLPPAGLGMMPSDSLPGKMKQNILRFLADKVLFRKSHNLYRSMLDDNYGIEATRNMFDYIVKKSTLFLQSGTPGFEYKRSDLGANIRFVGALLPVAKTTTTRLNLALKAVTFKNVILVTQGTVEKDPTKLIIPTIEAFKNTNNLVIVTTGGSRTAELRNRYNHVNVVIEDFIPFNEVLPLTDVFVSNGGYGGVMLSLEHNVPLVVGGTHEGKNEINARVEYFKLGINMNTETPTAEQVKGSVHNVLGDNSYKKNVQKLGAEFRQYNTLSLCTQYIHEVTGYTGVAASQQELVLQR